MYPSHEIELKNTTKSFVQKNVGLIELTNIPSIRVEIRRLLLHLCKERKSKQEQYPGEAAIK